MRNSVSALLLIALAGPLSGCDKGLNDKEMKALQDKINQEEEKRQQDAVSNFKFALSDGVTVCMRQVKAQLGEEAKVAEILSYFEQTERLNDASVHHPGPKPGTLTSCRVDYQDPANPQKLLRQEMQMKTGEFSAPKPLEIHVSGDAAKFNLNDHVSPIKKWNLDAVEKLVSAQSAAAEKKYSLYQIDSATLKIDPFNGRFVIRAAGNGRLKVNDVLEHNGVTVLVDGTKVTSAFK